MTRASPNAARHAFRVISETPEVITAEIPLSEWLQAPDHPRVRDVERHAKASHWPHAKRATGPVLEALRHVTAAQLDGVLYKVQGHTRAHLWANGYLPPPQTLQATIFKLISRQELLDLYDVFDAPSTSRRSIDRVSGAYRANGLKLTSNRLKDGAIRDALNLALRGATPPNQTKDRPPLDIYKAVTLYSDELATLDTLNPQPDIFYSGIVATALVGIALHPKEALPFLQQLAARNGKKDDGRSDPVQALLSCIESFQFSARQRVSWIRSEQEELFGRSLRALIAWVDAQQGKDRQYWFTRRLRMLDPMPYIEAVKQLKGVIDNQEV